MPVQSRQQRLRENLPPSADELEAVRELNAARRVDRRRVRERGDPNEALEERIAELEEYRHRAIDMQRPYYAINGSKRSADLRARLNDVQNPPSAEERANLLGMLEVNRRYMWWKRRHPNQ